MARNPDDRFSRDVEMYNNELPREKSYAIVCTPSKDSDQTGHPS